MTSSDRLLVLSASIARGLPRSLDMLAELTTDPADLAAIARLKTWAGDVREFIAKP